MRRVRWVLLALAALVFVSAPAEVEAQAVTVQGEVHYQPYGQGYGQPPPGYGPQYGQPQYGQPQYGQTYAPAYAPTYPAPARQVRYVDRSTSVKGLWIPGVVIFGASWVMTGVLATSLSLNGEYAGYSWIPLAGPWLMLSAATNEDEVAGALVGGVTQVAGAVMFVLGLALRQTVRVPVYSLDERDERAPQIALDVSPAPAGGLVGLSLTHF